MEEDTVCSLADMDFDELDEHPDVRKIIEGASDDAVLCNVINVLLKRFRKSVYLGSELLSDVFFETDGKRVLLSTTVRKVHKSSKKGGVIPETCIGRLPGSWDF